MNSKTGGAIDVSFRKRLPTPNSMEDWLNEIALAYQDALEAVPLADIIGEKIEEKDLFHFAPLICLKSRGLPQSKKHQKQATEAALSSLISTESINPEITESPVIAFAFAYLASHFGLGLLSEKEVTKIMNFVEHRQKQLEIKCKKYDRYKTRKIR